MKSVCHYGIKRITSVFRETVQYNVNILSICIFTSTCIQFCIHSFFSLPLKVTMCLKEQDETRSLLSSRLENRVPWYSGLSVRSMSNADFYTPQGTCDFLIVMRHIVFFSL